MVCFRTTYEFGSRSCFPVGGHLSVYGHVYGPQLLRAASSSFWRPLIILLSSGGEITSEAGGRAEDGAECYLETVKQTSRASAGGSIMVVVIEGISGSSVVGAAVVVNEVGSEVPDEEEDTLPPLGPPDFFSGFSGKRPLNLEISPIFFRKPHAVVLSKTVCGKSLSSEVILHDFSAIMVWLSMPAPCRLHA